MKRIPAVAFLALLAACQSSAPPSGALTPSPPSGALPAPGADVPASAAAFQGTWAGKWNGSFDGRIVIQTVAKDGAITGTYSWGEAPGAFKAGSAAVSGFIIRNVLTVSPDAETDLTYTMQPDGTLAGTFFKDGTTFTGTFRRV